MTAVHFTIIPCESYKPIDYKESQIFAVFVPALAKFCMLGLKVENVSGFFFFLFQRFQSFGALKIWPNVSVAFFLS